MSRTHSAASRKGEKRTGMRLLSTGFILPRARVSISLAGLAAADLDAVLTGFQLHVIPQENMVRGANRPLANTVDLQLHRAAVGVDLHRRFRFAAVDEAPAGDVDK